MERDNNNNDNNIKKRRKIRTISLSTKLGALKELKNGASVRSIANNLKVTTMTVRNWKKDQEKIVKWGEEHNIDNTMSHEKKRIRKPNNDLVDQATWIWFQEKRAAGVPIQGALIQLQAKFFNTMFGGNENFEASNGWLYRWQKRHNVRCLTICGEKLSADEDAAKAYKTEFRNYIEAEGLALDQIFNCDETGLNYKMIPKRTLSAKSEEGAPGIKGKKERVTVMACSNATGTLKLPLVLIGKYAKPRAIKNLSSLPVYYKSQKSAWINASILKEWFETEFVPKVTEFLHAKALPNKAVLFMDNCAAHPPLSKNNIIVKFFPPNTTSLIQPMDQGCLQNLKLLYRQSLMIHIVEYVNRGETLTQSLKDISIKDVIYWVAYAWERVTNTTIRKSWNPLLPTGDYDNVYDQNAGRNAIKPQNTEDSEDDVLACQLHQFCQAIQQDDQYKDVEVGRVNQWYHSSAPFWPEDCLSDQEIVDIIKGKEPHADQENLIDGDMASQSAGQKISVFEARSALNTLITYCEANVSSKETLLTLYGLKENLKCKELLEAKQVNKS